MEYAFSFPLFIEKVLFLFLLIELLLFKEIGFLLYELFNLF